MFQFASAGANLPPPPVGDQRMEIFDNQALARCVHVAQLI